MSGAWHNTYAALIPGIDQQDVEAGLRQNIAQQQLEHDLQLLDVREIGLQRAIDSINLEWDEIRKPYVQKIESVRLTRSSIKSRGSLNSGLPQSGPASFGFVEGACFQCAATSIIILNLLVVIVQCMTSDRFEVEMAIVNELFLIWYIIEIVFKGMYFRSALFCGNFYIVCWNWFDAAIIVAGVVDQWLLPLLSSFFVDATQGQSNSLQVLRTLRLLRLVRFIRVLRLVKVMVQSEPSWVDGLYFETFMLCVIMSNAVITGVELDHPWNGWLWVESVFLCIYIFEMFFRLKYMGWSFFGFTGSWAMRYLDLVIVIAGFLEQWLIPCLNVFASATESGPSSLKFLVIFSKIFRILRVLRLLRAVHRFKPLYILVLGLMEAMRSMQWLVLLVVLVIYTWSIVFTFFFGKGFAFGGDPSPNAKAKYGKIDESMVSLFKMMNQDYGALQPIQHLLSGKILFFFFMVMSNWAVLAIVTSIMSDRLVAASSTLEREESNREGELRSKLRTRKLRTIFMRADIENTGRISQEQFMDMLFDVGSRNEICAAAGLDTLALVEAFNLVARGDATARQADYERFIKQLDDEGKTLTKRSVKRVGANLHMMERRLHVGLHKTLQTLKPESASLHKTASAQNLLDVYEVEMHASRHTASQLRRMQ